MASKQYYDNEICSLETMKEMLTAYQIEIAAIYMIFW